jgi:hypothetical protein
MPQVAQTEKLASPDFRAVVSTQVTLLTAVGKLMKSLDPTDPESLRRVNALLSAGLAGVKGELSIPQAVAAEPSSIEVRRQEFITKYDVKVLADGQVSFTLPSGASRLDLLNDAQALAPELLNRPAVYADRLAKWAQDTAFTTKVTEATSRSIDGNVSDSTRKTRAEQEAKGWNNVDLADLATAHQAYLIATGKDLFNGNVVRARGGALNFNAFGLDVYDFSVDDRSNFVAASASLSPRN